MKNTNFALATLTVGILLSFQGQALAQEAEQQTAEQVEKGMIDRITISARKKQESVQDVGVSITSLNADDIKNLGIKKMEDLVKTVSALDIKQANAEGNINITLRGVGLNDFSSTMSPTVGVYVDEVFLSNTGMLGFSLFDIERVEVLKGPQGTLYGRNTTGGAITFQSAKPVNDVASGYIDATVGDYNSTEFQGAITGGVTDEFSMRLSGIVRNQGESFYTNYGTVDAANFDFTPDGTSNDIGSSSLYSFRLAGLYEGDDLEVYANVHTGKSKTPPSPLEHFGGIDLSTGDICASVAGGNLRSQGDPNCTDFVGYQDQENTGNFGGFYQQFPKNEIDISGGVLKIDYTSDMGVFSSVTGYEKFERSATDDVSMNPLPEYLEITTAFNDVDQFSQEFRFAGETDGLEYILGVFYGSDEINGNYYLDAQILLPGLFGFPDDVPAQIDIDNTIYQKTDTSALFANLEWSLADDLSLITGLRYSSEEKEFTGLTRALGLDNFTQEVFTDLFGVPNLPLAQQNDKFDISKVSGSVGLEWKVQKNTLLYGTASQGFKSGGYKGAIAFDSFEYAPYKEEDLTAYEFGIKTRNAEGDIQFNASAFYYDYQDFQAIVPSSIGLALGNVEKASISGLEMDAWWNITDDFFLKGAGTWLNTEISDSNQAFDGNQMANSPDLSWNILAVYTMEVSDDYEMRFQGDIKYMDETYKSASNSPIELAPDYTILNARITLRPISDDWQLSLWIKNLNDEEYITQIYDQAGDFGANQAFFGEPRTIGMTFSYEY